MEADVGVPTNLKKHQKREAQAREVSEMIIERKENHSSFSRRRSGNCRPRGELQF
jgi:hypothetical protein